jgi:hypothetical protein
MRDRSRYPLAALAAFRSRLVEEARGALIQAAAAAAEARATALASRQAALEATARLRAAEAEPGGGEGVELAARARWLAGLRRGALELEAIAAGRGEEAQRTSSIEEGRRAVLAAAELQLRAVERHREGWEAQRRRSVAAAEEAEEEDRATAARAYRPT